MRTESDNARPCLVSVPGLYGSGAQHWQSWLEGEWPASRRVQQRDWSRPDLNEWADALRRLVAEVNAPVVIAAHSFGCLTTVEAFAQHAPHVIGALLVAPADPLRFDIDAARLMRRLPFSSIVVASDDDPWMAAPQAYRYARAWDSGWLALGAHGHINAEAGLGPWPLGKALLESLCQAHRGLEGAGAASDIDAAQ